MRCCYADVIMPYYIISCRYAAMPLPLFDGQLFDFRLAELQAAVATAVTLPP